MEPSRKLTHVAFSNVTILDKTPHKIEAIEIGGSFLLVGTMEGDLYIYGVKKDEELKDDDGGRAANLALIDAQKSFARKPINQMTVLEHNLILVSLSDAMVSVHDFPQINLRAQLLKSKGCHLYAVDTTSKTNPRLCVAVRKKLVIYTWSGSEFQETKELSIPDAAKSLVWCGESICIGFKREYNLINVKTGAMTELFPIGRSGNPLGILLPNEQLLLGRDNISIFIGYDGKPTRTYGLTWTEPPIALGYSFPYVIAVLSRFIEIRVMSDSQLLAQTIALKGTPRLLVAKDSSIYVAGTNTIWKLIPVPIMNQVEQLVNDREYAEALNLSDHIPDSAEKRAKREEIKLLYTFHLFSEGQYDQAINYFIELETDPLRVIGLYPNMLPKSIRSNFDKYPIEIPDLSGPALDKALAALPRFLRNKRPDVNVNSNSSDELVDEFANVKDMATIIDTSLLKAYAKINDPGLLPFLKAPNKCHLKESEIVLLSYRKFPELVEFYRSKQMHQKALELLAKLATPANDLTGQAILTVNDTIRYLQELGRDNWKLIVEFSRWVFKKSPEEALKVFTYQRSPDKVLPSHDVLQHIKQQEGAPSQLIIPFLEYIIHTNHETDPEFHNELIFSYLDIVQKLKRNDFYQQKSGERVVAGSEPGVLGATRKKLLAFLTSSTSYHPEKMLSKFPFDDLFEERAILLGRIGQHDQALNIYAHRLKDFSMAEQYCLNTYSSDNEEKKDVYLSLFKVYLKPSEEGAKPLIEPAIQLLNKHYKEIDMARALQLLPRETKIKDLVVFDAVLRDYSSKRRSNQVVKNLLKSENLQIREQWMQARSKMFRITEASVCPQCGKRIGDSVFVCYPTGSIVHYICHNKMEERNAQTKINSEEKLKF